MAFKTVTAIAIAVATLPALAQAQVTNKQAVYTSGAWRVERFDSTTASNGQTHHVCQLAQARPTTKGAASIGIFQNDRRDGFLMIYSEDGISWTYDGTLTLRVDSYPAITLPARKAENGAALFIGPLDAEGKSAMTELWNEAKVGSTLTVTTQVGTRPFPLAGSASAMTAWTDCLDKIAQEGPPVTLPPALPPATVKPVAPATGVRL